MSCTACRNKFCRTEARDCFDVKPSSLEVYADPATHSTALAASRLVDDGRAGTLDRLEEIIEYCRDMGYSRVGVAYCFGLPEHAAQLEKRLKQAGLTPVMVQCSVGGVREREVDSGKTKDTVACNPAGQALALKKKGAQLVIEMGLCMGHDVILHQVLDIPFTTFMVKDRVHEHNPARALGPVGDSLARLLTELDDSQRMLTPPQLLAWLAEDEPARPVLVDVRSAESFAAGHIPRSISVPLRALPERVGELLHHRKRRVVCLGEESAQSALAVAFLYERGFRDVYHLAGGIARWQGLGSVAQS